MKRSIRRPAAGTMIVEDVASASPGTATFSGVRGLTVRVTVHERPDGVLAVARGRISDDTEPVVERFVVRGVDALRAALGDGAQTGRVIARLRARAARDARPALL